MRAGSSLPSAGPSSGAPSSSLCVYRYVRSTTGCSLHFITIIIDINVSKLFVIKLISVQQSFFQDK